MLPSLSRDPDSNSSAKSAIYYTNEDVEFLHDVVSHAQELLPTLPERERIPTNALFSAYYALLHNVGFNADHDSRYARVLFKIGGSRTEATLFDKFRLVLLQMGIELEFEQETDNGAKKVEKDIADRPFDQISSGSHPTSRTEHPRPFNIVQRRSSDISLGLSERDVQFTRGSRRLSASMNLQSEVQHIQNNWPGLFGSPATTQEQTRALFNELPLHAADGESNLNFVTSGDLGPAREANSTESSPRIRPLSFDSRERNSNFYPTAHDAQVNLGVFRKGPTLRPDELHAETSRELLEELLESAPPLMSGEIKIFLKHRTKTFVKQHWSEWKRVAARLHEDNSNLEFLAVHQDKRILLHQAIESWQTLLKTRQRVAETERFFGHIERRADRAREIFVMHKSLIHWVRSSLEEIQKTSVARRHVLRIRFFEAWRDITVINELKIRRHILKTFFNSWRRRFSQQVIDYSIANSILLRNQERRFFSSWLRALQQRKSHEWETATLQRKNLVKWVVKTEEIMMNQAQVARQCQAGHTRKIFFKWKIRRLDLAETFGEADEFLGHALRFKILRLLGLEYSLSIPFRQLEGIVSFRLKQSFLSVWAVRNRQESLATSTDTSKLQRACLIMWRDTIRFRAIRLRLRHRILLHSVRAWILAEREILCGRLVNHNLGKKALDLVAKSPFFSKVATLQNTLLANRLSNHTNSRSVLSIWRARLSQTSETFGRASVLRTSKLTNYGVSQFVAKFGEIYELQTWAKDGEFYFLANKTMKTWVNATKTSKRTKRRASYVHVRQGNKVKLALHTLSQWRQRASIIMSVEHLSLQFGFNKDAKNGAQALELWKERVQRVANSKKWTDEMLVGKYFALIQQICSRQTRLETEAVVAHAEQGIHMGMQMWTRFFLKLLASEGLASRIREKYSKKTLKRILVHWNQRLLNGKPPPRNRNLDQLIQQGNLARSQNRTPERFDTVSEVGDAASNEDWSAKLEDEGVLLNIPGYLSTPSKRMSRMRAIENFASTTPAAPLSAPVERLLRAHYSGTYTSSLPRLSKNMRSVDSVGTEDRETQE